MSKRMPGKTCSHPLFSYASNNGWCECPENLSNPWVFIFERPRWKKPSKEQVDKYRQNQAIVEALGGYMRIQEYRLGGESPLLAKADVEDILAAVSRDNPTGRIVQHWNGEGCYSMSVGVEFPS